jgi:MinD-like ATPase involved in chromosome partitioning or flagellar assembly
VTHVVAVGSIKASAGATSTSLVLAASAAAGGQRSTLVETDPSGGSLLGWCADLDPSGPGLYEGVFQRDLTVGIQPLGGVAVIAAQGDPWRISSALDRPRGWRQLLDPLDGVVVVDVGRLFPGSPAAQIAGVADMVVLVAPAEPGPLAATLEWVARRGQFAATDAMIDADRVRIVTVNVAAERRQRIDPGRLARDELGPAYAGHVPFDDGALELLCRGASIDHRALRRSRLVVGVHGLLGRLNVGVTV